MSLNANNIDDNLRSALKHFLLCLPTATAYFIARCRKDDRFRKRLGSPTDKDVFDVFKKIEKIVKVNFSILAENAGSDVAKYDEKFDTQFHGIDYHKFAYFASMRVYKDILRYLKSVYLMQQCVAKALCSAATIHMLDDIVHVETGRHLETGVFLKLLATVTDFPVGGLTAPKWVDLYGEYGIYLITKNMNKFCSNCLFHEDSIDFYRHCTPLQDSERLPYAGRQPA